MITKRIPYVDFRGNTQIEDAYFHISKPDLIISAIQRGGIKDLIESMTRTSDPVEVLASLRTIVSMSYGRQTDDGKSFIKTDELTATFLGSNAWDTMFLNFLKFPEEMATFVNSLLPDGLVDEVDEIVKKHRPSDPNVIDGEVISDTAEKKLEDYSEIDLLSMPQDEFDRIIGTDTSKMSDAHFRIAFRRKNQQLV